MRDRIGSPRRICIVAPYAYPCLSGNYAAEQIGGAEIQQVFLAKALRERGFEVSFVTIDFGEPRIESIDGIRVFKAFRERDGIRGLRFIYPRLVKLWCAMREADADVYYTRTASFLPGLLRCFARTYGKKFIYGASSDANFDRALLKLPTRRDQLLYEFGLRGASAIVAQTRHQETLLQKNFGHSCTVIPNFLPATLEHRHPRDGDCILWASTLRRLKQPRHFLRLARALPNESFVMIGGADPHDPELYEKIRGESMRIPNLQFLGFQAYEVAERYFDRCRVFVNTSIYEGFPNTFLQAWSRGVPVVSYVDPDGVIEKWRLGIIVHDEDGLKEALQRLNDGREANPERILDYFRENHSSKVVDRYHALLDAI